MRIEIVTETWPPEVNGVARTVCELVVHLRALGHRVGLVRPRQACDGGGAPREEELLVRASALPRYPGLRVGWPCGAALARRWRAARPDAIYVATEGPLGWSALRAARALGIPVASGLHTRFDDYAAHYGFASLRPLALALMRRFHNAADATLVPTEDLRAQLVAHGFLRVARHARGVATELFDPRRRNDGTRRGWGLEPGELAVLHVGRLAAEKNLALALEAFAAIRARLPRARLVWVGDGPARGTIGSGAGEVVCGTLRGEALATHYASADLLLFPSLSETWGNVTAEALASGLPVVAYDYGAAHELVQDGVCGRLAAPGDAAGFVAAALALASDRAGLESMRGPARAAVAQRSQRAAAERFAELLARLASAMPAAA